ncbi:MAG: MATE family efflux transporter [Sneathiella sp.]|nr:MATE family efflux transporter [Sneathiella sp.]
MNTLQNAAVTNLSLWHHIQRTLQLAFPVILSRLGIIAMVSMDVIVLGRAGSNELADYVLGQSAFDTLLVMLIGLLMGVPVLTSRAIGAGREKDAGRVWYRGLFLAVLYGTLMFCVLQFAEHLYLASGQDPVQAARSADVTAVLAAAMPAVGIFSVCATLLESVNRPLIGTVAVWTANISNLVLNIVFVFGWGPIPAMGAIGCALATVINFSLLSLGLIWFIRTRFDERERYGVLEGRPTLWFGAEEQRKAGYGAGASFGLESAAFATLILMAGLLGELALASFGILFQFLALFFMGALGLAIATQIRVGNAWGRDDNHGMKYAGWVGLGLSVVFTGSTSLLLYIAPEFMVGIFTNDQEIILAAVPVLIWVAAAIVFDGGQVVVNHACRGRGDAWVPTACHFMSYWLVMIPISAFCAFALELGVTGIYMGVAISAVFSVFVLSFRFAWLSNR